MTSFKLKILLYIYIPSVTNKVTSFRPLLRTVEPICLQRSTGKAGFTLDIMHVQESSEETNHTFT